jgi:hypothetical protein
MIPDMTTEEWIAYHLAKAPSFTQDQHRRADAHLSRARRDRFERELTPSEPVDAEDS